MEDFIDKLAHVTDKEFGENKGLNWLYRGAGQRVRDTSNQLTSLRQVESKFLTGGSNRKYNPTPYDLN